jgi:hypothetical protein
MARRKPTEIVTLPAFQSDQEAGDFWDTHSPLDYPEDFQETPATFARPLLKRGLTIPLSEDTLAQLTRLGRERGIGPATLARMWILEHLQSLHAQERGTPPRPA